MTSLLVDLYFIVAFLMFARCVLQVRPIVKKYCKGARVGRILVLHSMKSIEYARYLKTPTGLCHVGDETILREHKIFPTARYINPYSVIKTCTITPEMNDRLLQCVYDTIEKYFLKYLVTFSRTNGRGMGKLMIGMTDEGKPIGIPLVKGTMICQKRIAHIIDSLRGRMRGMCNGGPCSNTLDAYMRYVKIHIKTLEDNAYEREFYMEKLIDDVDDEMKMNNEIKDEFDEQMNTWRIHRDKFLISLEDLCKNPITRNEIIEYCYTGRSTQAPQEVIDKLKSDDDILFPIGTVRDAKMDESTMAFWVTNFKEDMRASQVKPRRRVYIRKASIEMMHAANDLSFMRKNWSGSVEYQMVVIEFPTSLSWNKWIEYKVSSSSKEWTSLTRSINGNGPSCIHL